MVGGEIVDMLSSLGPVDDNINWPPGRCEGPEPSTPVMMILPNKDFNMENTDRRRYELMDMLTDRRRYELMDMLSQKQQPVQNKKSPTYYLDDGAIELVLDDKEAEESDGCNDPETRHVMSGGRGSPSKHVMSGGSADHSPSKHVMSGGGLISGFKKLYYKLRSFDKYIKDYEAAKTKISKRMIAYEAETARLKVISDEWSSALKKLFLNEKYKVMWELERDKTYDPKKQPKYAYKHKMLNQEIKRIEIEQKRLMKTIDRLRETASEKMNLVFKVFGITIFTKKDFKIGNITIVNNYIGKFKERLEKDQKLFLDIAEGFNAFAEEIAKATELKAMYAIIGGKDTKELTSLHRKEAAQYLKNKEKYEKMLSFTDARRDELLKLIQRKERIFQELDFYRNVLEFGGFDTIHGNIRSVLDKQWIPAMKSVFGDLSDAISQGEKWKKVLDGIKGKISDNGNQIGKLTAGKAEFTPVKREYENQLENMEKVIEIQKDIGTTLTEIKNNFVKLVPDVNLLPDMFHVASAQGFIVEMMNDIKARQTAMGKDLASATEAIKKKITLSGGSADHSPAKHVMSGGSTDHSPAKHVMSGGMLINLYPANTQIPTFLFNNAGYLWDANINAWVDNATTQKTTIDAMNPLPLPFGLRPIEDNSIAGDSYNDNMNTYIKNYYNNYFFYNAVYNIAEDTVSIVTYGYDKSTGDPVIVGVNEMGTYIPHAYNDIPVLPDHRFYMPFDRQHITTPNHPENKIINAIKLDNSDLIILPLFYLFRRQEITFEFDEYILLSPYNGKPLASISNFNTSDFSYNGDAYDYLNGTNNDLRINLYACHSPNFISNKIKSNAWDINNTYYYNYCGSDFLAIGKDDPIHLPQDKSKTVPFINYIFAATNNNILPDDTTESSECTEFNQIDDDPEIPKNIEQESMCMLTQFLNIIFNNISDIEFDSANVVNNIVGNNSTQKLKNIDSALTILPLFNPKYQDLSFNNFTKLELCQLLGIPTSNESEFTNEVLNTCILLKDTIARIQYDTSISGINNYMAYLTPNPAMFGMGGIPGGGFIQPAFIHDPNGSGLMIPNPAAGQYQSILAPKPLHPTVVKALDYLKRILDPSSPYWSNLKLILDEIEKFFSKDYLDYEQSLMKILDQMMEIRKFEEDVLKIDIGKDKDVIPSYSYIYKNLEVKIDPSSKEGYSTAGKGLYEKLKQNRDYIKYNKATLDVNPENIIYDLHDDLLMKILLGPPAPQFTTYFFQTGKGLKYKEYLQTKEGAETFFRELSKNPNYGQGFNRAKIAHAIMLALLTYTSDPDVYNLYKAEAGLSISKQPANKQGKQTKKNPKGQSQGQQQGQQQQGQQQQGQQQQQQQGT